MLVGHVVPSVDEAADDVLAVSLILNAEIGRNKGSFLAYDEAGDELLLLRRLDNPAMRFSEFETVLNDFASHIVHCRTALLTEGEGDDEDDDSETPRRRAGRGRDGDVPALSVMT